MPSQMEHPPAPMADSVCGGGSTCTDLCKHLPPDLIHALHQYAFSHPFLKIVYKDPSDY